MRRPRDPAGPTLARSVRAALREDRAGQDRTTRAVVPAGVAAVGEVRVQARGIVSGIAAARAAAEWGGLRFVAAVRDGARVRPGTLVVTLIGEARRILAVERTLLNLLMHASGVATATAAAVAAGRRGPGRPLLILGTRKTTPGWRDLERAAIVHGGGRPHRRDLASGLLIKSNHLALVPVEEAVRRARRARRPSERLEVEVRSAEEAVRAARAGADALLLDNLRPTAAARVVRALARAGLRRGRWIELSGGLSAARLPRYRRSGADAASLGSLTHSAPALPFHLVLRPAALRRRGGSR